MTNVQSVTRTIKIENKPRKIYVRNSTKNISVSPKTTEIHVDQINKNINLQQDVRSLNVKNITREIEIHSVGRRGPQGIQGEQGPPGSSGPAGVYEIEMLSGQDGVNTTFSTTFDYVPGSISVYLNGLRQDFLSVTESGANQIEFDEPPYASDSIIVEYAKE